MRTATSMPSSPPCCPPGEMQKVRELVKSDSHLDDGPSADEAQGNRDGVNQTPDHGDREKR